MLAVRAERRREGGRAEVSFAEELDTDRLEARYDGGVLTGEHPGRPIADTVAPC